MSRGCRKKEEKSCRQFALLTLQAKAAGCLIITMTCILKCLDSHSVENTARGSFTRGIARLILEQQNWVPYLSMIATSLGVFKAARAAPSRNLKASVASIWR